MKLYMWDIFRFKIFLLSHLFSLSPLWDKLADCVLFFYPLHLFPTNHCNIQTFLFSLNYIQFFPCKNFHSITHTHIYLFPNSAHLLPSSASTSYTFHWQFQFGLRLHQFGHFWAIKNIN